MGEPHIPPLRFSVPLIQTLAIVIGTATAGLGIALLVASMYELLNGKSASIWAPVLGILPLCAALAIMLFRIGLLASAEVSDTSVTIRRNFASKRFPLIDIVDVEVVPGSSLIVPWKVPALRLRGGRVVRVEYLRILGGVDGTPVDAFTSAVRDRIPSTA